MNDEAGYPDQDKADAAILNVDIDDVAIEIAAAGVGTIPPRPSIWCRPTAALTGRNAKRNRVGKIVTEPEPRADTLLISDFAHAA